VTAMSVVAAIATMMTPLAVLTAMVAILHVFNVLDLRRRHGRNRHRRRCSKRREGHQSGQGNRADNLCDGSHEGLLTSGSGNGIFADRFLVVVTKHA
jgi:hypothetical protein